jgi:hypothetical protein
VKHFVIIIVTLLFFGVATAQNGEVQPEGCRKSLKVDEFLLPEDATAAKNTFEKFRKALLSGNREQVIAMMKFPADLILDGYPLKFDTPNEFAYKYDKFFTGYVIESVHNQAPEELLAGWDGVSLSNGAISFARSGNGEFLVSNIIPNYEPLPDSIADFLDHRLTCPPVVVDGQIVAYNWVSHTFPGSEGIYADHFIVDVINVLSGNVTQKRIRVDFWGVSHMPEYKLPPKAFEPDSVWRMYLRPAAMSPSNDEVCAKDVQELITNVDETGRELSKESAIKVLIGKDTPTYADLPCYETHKQFFSITDLKAPIP